MRDISPRPVTPVGILAQELDRIARRVDAMDGIEPSLRDDVLRVRDLACGLDPYIEDLSSPESPALAALAAATRDHDWGSHGGGLEQEMLSGHVEGRFLRTLVRATRARRVLEIGMFTGYSALAMAEALPADGRLVACEVDRVAADLARAHFARSPAGERITVEVGPAAASLARLAAAGEVFDLVFVDADKGGYLGYLQTVLGTGLLAAGGLICVDNTLMQGQPWSSGATPTNGREIAAFNRAVAADARLEQVVVPLRDGVTLIMRAESA